MPLDQMFVDEAISLSRTGLIRILSKAVVWFTLLLIFVGGFVTSTDSGLSVPDWPLTYGMVFPPMLGGVLFEHGHRLVATLDGLIVLCLAMLIAAWEKRLWLKIVAFSCLGLVIVQGILGGLTVLFLLPVWLSVSHAVVSQTFLLACVLLAYGLSYEHWQRGFAVEKFHASLFHKFLVFLGLVYVQLIIASIMRHTDSGLAIPDFPKMGGQWLPSFNQAMVERINAWRLAHAMDPVTLGQVKIHFLHRFVALMLVLALVDINLTIAKRKEKIAPVIVNTVYGLDFLFICQLSLGVATVLTREDPLLTTMHVVGGAGVLATAFLLVLRAYPARLSDRAKDSTY